MSTKFHFINKEISWLSFNERVLQEAKDPSVTIADRLKFLGIYSNNLDEFFRIRVATLKRLAELGSKSIRLIDDDPKEILEIIQNTVIRQHREFNKTLYEIKKELMQYDIYFIDENNLDQEQGDYVLNYLIKEVRPKIFPIMIYTKYIFPTLHDHSLYLLVELFNSNKSSKKKTSIIEIPSKTIKRFIMLPQKNNKKYIMFLEDVIRYGLKYIFSSLPYDTFKAYDIKLTRDAELDIDDDFEFSYLHKIHRSLEKRKLGNPVRFTYDKTIPKEMLLFLKNKLKLKSVDTLLPGGRYHNSKDFINFPDIIGNEHPGHYRSKLEHKDMRDQRSIFKAVRKKDLLIHFPYHSFDYIIDLLREASMDPKVISIKITIYRVAKNSSVINALINARKNHKEVTVVLELQARFDEKANIEWANKLKEEGVRVVFGIPGLKVHSKLCLITRKKKHDEFIRFCALGTGNFNEDTANRYTDTYLLTADPKITAEVDNLFDFFENNYKVTDFINLIVSPFNARSFITSMIEREIAMVNAGKEAYIYLKINNLSDRNIIAMLYKAAQAGVKIKLIVRSMMSLIPQATELSENIEAISIVDIYLEHSRYFIFQNGGNEEVYLSSSDFLPRNFERRVEVTVPVYDPALMEEIKTLFSIEWQDNTKARQLNRNLDNTYIHNSLSPFKETDTPISESRKKKKPFRAQEEKYQYLKGLHHK